MPRLSSVDARKAEQQAEESATRFDPVPAGVYIGRLREVAVSDKPGNSGFDYWMWRFDIVDEGFEGKGLQAVTSLSPKALFSMGAVFKAFGVPADTDTDELVGKLVLLDAVQVPRNDNPNKMTNQVNEVLPYDGDQPQTLDGAAASVDDF